MKEEKKKDQDNNYFTQNIKEIREFNGFSIAHVSRGINIKYSTYQAYEQGRAYPPIEILKRICQFYKLTADELLIKKFDRRNWRSIYM